MPVLSVIQFTLSHSSFLTCHEGSHCKQERYISNSRSMITTQLASVIVLKSIAIQLEVQSGCAASEDLQVGISGCCQRHTR